jgi:hypothetical protein
MPDAPRPSSWTELLEEEDLSFIKRFVLGSGSLKEIAAIYGVSYPTVRLRLDRLIEKIKVIDSQEALTPFERLLRLQHAEGQIALSTMKRLLAAHREEVEHEVRRRSK